MAPSKLQQFHKKSRPRSHSRHTQCQWIRLRQLGTGLSPTETLVESADTGVAVKEIVTILLAERASRQVMEAWNLGVSARRPLPVDHSEEQITPDRPTLPRLLSALPASASQPSESLQPDDRVVKRTRCHVGTPRRGGFLSYAGVEHYCHRVCVGPTTLRPAEGSRLVAVLGWWTFPAPLSPIPTTGSRERATGIEPAFRAWEARVLPLNYARVPGNRIRRPLTAAPTAIRTCG